jgi:hypothetical protein
VRAADDLAEILAEEFLFSATSAEEATDEIRGIDDDQLTLRSRPARGRRRESADASALPPHVETPATTGEATISD